MRPLDGGNERTLTKDGDDNLLNGEVDWVYEEELYTRSNYFWSPDGKQIAFLQMNEKEVPTYPITDWIPTHATVDQEKYPQPGDPNPDVRLAVVGSDGGKIKWINAGTGNGDAAAGQRSRCSGSALRMGARRPAVGDGCLTACKTGWTCISWMSTAASGS